MKRPDPQFGWSFYDFGNSAFATTVVGALLPAHFEESVLAVGEVSFLGGIWTAESLWALVVGVGPLLMLMVMPVLWAVADRSRLKARYLAVFSYGSCLATVALFFAAEGDVVYTLLVFLTALLLFSGANVFYDGILTDISSPETIHRISARGVAYGFIGGGLHLGIAYAIVALFPSSVATRVAISSAGVWFGVVAFISLRALGGSGSPSGARQPFRDSLGAGFAKTKATLSRIRMYPDLTRFIVAYILYGNGIQTVVALTAVYSAQTLRHDPTTIILAFLIVQVLAIPGCYLAARLTSRLGPKPVLSFTLASWALVIGAAAGLPAGASLPYYGLAVLIGLILGPAIALSRSIYASMVPEGSSAEFFGFYSLTSKLAALGGPLIFVWIRQTTGSGRAAIVMLSTLIVAGLAVFRRVDVDRAAGGSVRVRAQ